MRYLGIDFGAKRVGVAISDDNGVFAFPLKILPNNKELVDMVHNICGEEGIGEIVIGESMDFSGKPNEIMGEIEKFKNKLNSEVGLPMHMQREFMTSVHSGEQKTKNIFKDKKKKRVSFAKASADRRKNDSEAAALILQRYLDKKNQGD